MTTNQPTNDQLTKVERLANELFVEGLRGVPINEATDVQLGDALRGALMALTTVVVWELDGRGQTFVEALGFVSYPYTSQAIDAVDFVSN